MISFLINLSIAILWTVLLWKITFANFILGFIVGFILLSVYSKLFNQLDYTRRLWGFLRFVPIFTFSFIKANLEVASVILLTPNSNLQPTIFSYDISNLSNIEALLLSHVISLTPGTITVDISKKTSTILVHSLHYKNPKQTEDEITHRFKNSILRFTR